jgi:hypothetical protein
MRSNTQSILRKIILPKHDGSNDLMMCQRKAQVIYERHFTRVLFLLNNDLAIRACILEAGQI